MLAFDTNHLLRFLLQDDPRQCRQVTQWMDEQDRNGVPIHLLDLVLMETHWVLRSAYGFGRQAWSSVLEDLLNDPIFSFDDPSRLWIALEMFKKGKADFDDYLILAQCKTQGLELQTFDKKLQRDL